MTYVIGGTQATARFCCCCFTETSNGVFGNDCSSAELLVPPAESFQLAVLLFTALLLSLTFCQHKYPFQDI